MRNDSFDSSNSKSSFWREIEIHVVSSYVFMDNSNHPSNYQGTQNHQPNRNTRFYSLTSPTFSFWKLKIPLTYSLRNKNKHTINFSIHYRPKYSWNPSTYRSSPFFGFNSYRVCSLWTTLAEKPTHHKNQGRYIFSQKTLLNFTTIGKPRIAFSIKSSE